MNRSAKLLLYLMVIISALLTLTFVNAACQQSDADLPTASEPTASLSKPSSDATEPTSRSTESTSVSALPSVVTTTEPVPVTSVPQSVATTPPITTAPPPVTTTAPITTAPPAITAPALSDEEIAALNDCGGIVYFGDSRIVAIDAGHQSKAMREKEPNGPGSDELKAKLTSGTQGISTRLAEYQLNLNVALKLRDELIARGYTVVMIRESNDVTLSNADRAQIANRAGADAFVRIHANGSENKSARGAFTICQTVDNPYNGNLHSESYRLSDLLIDGYIEKTGMKQLKIWETDTMTGINWAQVPSTIIEMGYMSNVEEDEKMATETFWKAAAIGMANGLDAYFAG